MLRPLVSLDFSAATAVDHFPISHSFFPMQRQVVLLCLVWCMSFVAALTQSDVAKAKDLVRRAAGPVADIGKKILFENHFFSGK
jgi:hypothetical protein